MSLPHPAVVVTLTTPGATRAHDREALLAAVASAAGVDVASVRAGRVRPHLGRRAPLFLPVLVTVAG